MAANSYHKTLSLKGIKEEVENIQIFVTHRKQLLTKNVTKTSKIFKMEGLLLRIVIKLKKMSTIQIMTRNLRFRSIYKIVLNTYKSKWIIKMRI